MKNKVADDLLDRGIVYFSGEVTDKSCRLAMQKLIYLNNKKKDVYLLINSPGGSVSAGCQIIDFIQMMNPNVYTVCTALAASMGSLFLMCGKKGNRMIFEHGRVLLHQPLISGNMVDKCTNLEIQADQMMKTRENLYKIINNHTGQSMEKIKKDCELDYWLDAEEAVKYGVCDKVITKLPF